ncbi:hypothetical protein, partial [Heyndrickxia sporothermodurans]|uniref:hypothetical protein n=1 Tax=Heyndrickxia sporothermodurans TaxID=46224 RepID=UPI00196AB9A2
MFITSIGIPRPNLFISKFYGLLKEEIFPFKIIILEAVTPLETIAMTELQWIVLLWQVQNSLFAPLLFFLCQ